jgi:hypothetical protein
LAIARSPENAWSDTALYRSPESPATSISPGSREIAASTRGSSWDASATTSRQPGSATTARRITFGICSPPPPFVTQRPDTVPPGTNPGRNRPSWTQSCNQLQPFAV